MSIIKSIVSKCNSGRHAIYIYMAILLAILLGYVVSYPIILPLIEKTDYGIYGYVIYEPIEIIRNSNASFWHLTECCYKACGGKTLPLYRVYFKSSQRRMIGWHKNGVKSFDISGVNNFVLHSMSWYEDGKPKLESSLYGNGGLKNLRRWNASGIMTYCDSYDESGNGQAKWYGDDGKLIASIQLRNFNFWDGSILSVPEKEFNTINIYLIYYKNGKIQNKVLYSQKKEL